MKIEEKKRSVGGGACTRILFAWVPAFAGMTFKWTNPGGDFGPLALSANTQSVS